MFSGIYNILVLKILDMQKTKCAFFFILMRILFKQYIYLVFAIYGFCFRGITPHGFTTCIPYAATIFAYLAFMTIEDCKIFFIFAYSQPYGYGIVSIWEK